jgi:predicted acyl esterase
MARIGKAPQRLLLGPWKHGYNVDRALNGYSYGLDALREDVWLLKQQWYDNHLKGMDNGITRTRVEYFVLGENRWRTTSAWPARGRAAAVFPERRRGQRLFPAGRLTREPLPTLSRPTATSTIPGIRRPTG